MRNFPLGKIRYSSIPETLVIPARKRGEFFFQWRVADGLSAGSGPKGVLLKSNQINKACVNSSGSFGPKKDLPPPDWPSILWGPIGISAPLSDCLLAEFPVKPSPSDATSPFRERTRNRFFLLSVPFLISLPFLPHPLLL